MVDSTDETLSEEEMASLSKVMGSEDIESKDLVSTDEDKTVEKSASLTEDEENIIDPTLDERSIPPTTADNSSQQKKSSIARAQFLQLEDESQEQEAEKDLSWLKNTQAKVQIRIGQKQMTLDNILQLKEKSVVTVDRLAGEPVDVVVHGEVVAKGEVIIAMDNFGIKILDIVGTPESKPLIGG